MASLYPWSLYPTERKPDPYRLKNWFNWRNLDTSTEYLKATLKDQVEWLGISTRKAPPYLMRIRRQFQRQITDRAVEPDVCPGASKRQFSPDLVRYCLVGEYSGTYTSFRLRPFEDCPLWRSKQRSSE